MKFLTEIKKYQDLDYAKFNARCVPNIDSKTIIGVRVPKQRELAKEFFNMKEKEEFYKSLPHKYLEENMIHVMMISLEEDFNRTIELLENFFPYMDNWQVTDQRVPKSFKKHHEELVPYLYKWVNSKHTYTSRYAMNILLNSFLDEEFDEKFLKLVANRKTDDYYLQMMEAWYFSFALIKQYETTLPYIENKILDKWIHNKTISKCVDSYRLTKEQKDYLKSLRIK